MLLEDAEKIDPLINSVLNKETIKGSGGREMIRIGDKEIDFNSSFKLFMITRDSSIQFGADICSRVTFVNFTVTPSSLTAQCLNLFVKNEQPKVEEKRRKLLSLQGE